jgi:FkbM family methyltransferase
MFRRRPREALPELLGKLAKARPDAFFVEIGANDGVQHDHLRPFVTDSRWRGIMVEPVPYVFDRLKENYRGIDRVVLENAAVAERDGELPFYYLRDASPEERAALPDWYDGIGSFSRDAVLSHGRDLPDVAERIVEARVPALTFETLLRRHRAPNPDLVVIDAEGYDHRIVGSIDLDRYRPALVVYEQYHLDAGTRAETRAAMEAAGYETAEEGFNTICLDPALGLGPVKPGIPGVARYEEHA